MSIAPCRNLTAPRPYGAHGALVSMLLVGSSFALASCGGSDGADSPSAATAGRAGSAGSAGSSGGGTSGSSGSSGEAAAGYTPSRTPQTLPAAVTGIRGCKGLECGDIGRACDDFIRSGCAEKQFASSDPGTGPGDAVFREAVASCASVVIMEFLEEEASEGESATTPERRRERVAEAAMLAGCTRAARSCAVMAECFRGVQAIPPAFDQLEELVKKAPKTPYVAPAAPPFWKTPYQGEGADPLVTATPWGKPIVLEGLDVPACARCAVNRCPTFAYYCYGAATDPSDCPGGDCCQALRRCVRDCGGYDAYVSLEEHDACFDSCASGRPNGVQQLADLQQCGDEACTGCQNVTSTGGVQAP